MAERRYLPSPWMLLALSMVVTTCLVISGRTKVIVAHASVPTSFEHRLVVAGSRVERSLTHPTRHTTTTRVPVAASLPMHPTTAALASSSTHRRWVLAVTQTPVRTNSTSTTTTTISTPTTTVPAVTAAHDRVASTQGYLTSPDAVEASYAITASTATLSATVTVRNTGSLNATLACGASTTNALISTSATLTLANSTTPCTLTLAAATPGTVTYSVTTSGTFS